VRRRREPSLSGNERLDPLELLATVLLALAAVATAWSGYQASRWNGEQAKAFSRGNAERIESTRSSSRADAETQVDVATFTQWVNAYALHESELANFYFRRFRKEFKPALNAWIASRPLENARAPLTPFAMPQYKLAAREEATRLDAEAEAFSAKGRTDVQRATNYVLGVVLFAVALFFAGMSTRLRARSMRIALLACGVLVFVGTLVWLATLPISVAV